MRTVLFTGLVALAVTASDAHARPIHDLSSLSPSVQQIEAIGSMDVHPADARLMHGAEEGMQMTVVPNPDPGMMGLVLLLGLAIVAVVRHIRQAEESERIA